MSDCSFKHELFSLFALLQSSEKINSEPKCQWVQAQVQYAGQYALLHQTTHLKCHKLRLFVNNLKKNVCGCVSFYMLFDQPKPANTPTPPRPQGQPSPSIVVQQPQAVYGQTVCFPQMYPLTPVSPGVQVRCPLACWNADHLEHLIESAWIAKFIKNKSLTTVTMSTPDMSAYVLPLLFSFSVFDSSLMHAVIVFAIFLSFNLIFNRIRVTSVLFWARNVHPSHHFLSSVIFKTLVIYLHYLKNV